MFFLQILRFGWRVWKCFKELPSSQRPLESLLLARASNVSSSDQVATIKKQAENLVDIDTVLGPMLAKMDKTGQAGTSEKWRSSFWGFTLHKSFWVRQRDWKVRFWFQPWQPKGGSTEASLMIRIWSLWLGLLEFSIVFPPLHQSDSSFLLDSLKLRSKSRAHEATNWPLYRGDSGRFDSSFGHGMLWTPFAAPTEARPRACSGQWMPDSKQLWVLSP